MIQKTQDSLKIYVEFLGTETENGNLAVTDEFLENLESVYIMGRTGVVNHGMSDQSTTQIRIMEWIDNEFSTEIDFEDFVSLLNEYYGTDGLVGSYENMSDETYVWSDYSTISHVACWYADNTIYMNWQYNESLNKEVSAIKDLMQPVDGSQNTADDEIIQQVLEDRQRENPKIGMTAEEVLESTWGEPKDINKTTYSWGVKEQWCYSNYRYIYLEDGIVTSISE